jgi:hypothetical protein
MRGGRLSAIVPQTRMRPFLVLLLLSFLKTVSSQLFELTAEVKSDGNWEILGIRPTQLHKEVNEANPTHVERQHFSFDEKDGGIALIRIYGASEDAVRSRLDLEVAYNVIARPSIINDKKASQTPFGLEGELDKPLPPSPPLTVTPLWVSGPSDNRIDLVFFADGCK